MLDDGASMLIRVRQTHAFPTMNEILKGLRDNGDKRIQVTSATGGSQQKLNVLYEFKAEEQGQQDSSMMKHVKFGVKCLPYVGALYKYGSDLMNCKDAYYQIYETPVDFKITTLPMDSPQAVLPNTAYTFNHLPAT